MNVSVVIPTHNPDTTRLARTLAGLRAQTLPRADFEILLIDNLSDLDHAAAIADAVERMGLEGVRVITERQLGVTFARLRGVEEARGELLVFVDDDNVLAPTYLASVRDFFNGEPTVGVAGGKALPEFEITPEPWLEEFLHLLALRDLGDAPLLSDTFGKGSPREFPMFAPFGAGMALRRQAACEWASNVRRSETRLRLGRNGAQLMSGDDNDIVLSALDHGWRIAYLPQLKLTHLIPAWRLAPGYIKRMNRSLQNTWVQVLAMHDACPYKSISRWSLIPRKIKAWLASMPWRDNASSVRWQGRCGTLEGRAAIRSLAPLS